MRVKSVNYSTVFICDVIFLMLMYLIPTLSHLTSWTLYMFEPMRCVLLLNLLVLGNKKNAYLMAITLPLFSYFVGSHPVLVKSLIMTIELVMNIWLFDMFTRKVANCMLAMLLSILVSKALYYSLKYVSISFGLLNTDIVDTNIFIQLMVALIISMLFVKYTERKV